MKAGAWQKGMVGLVGVANKRLLHGLPPATNGKVLVAWESAYCLTRQKYHIFMRKAKCRWGGRRAMGHAVACRLSAEKKPRGSYAATREILFLFFSRY